MKKLVLVVLIVMVGIITSLNIANAEEKPEQIISVNPLGLVFGITNVEYEKVFKDNTTWALRGLYWGQETGDWSWSAIGAGGSYRKYFSPNTNPKVFTGGFWGAGVDFLNISADLESFGDTESGSAFFFGPKGEIGYKWLLGQENNISVSIAGELGYYMGSLEIADTSIPFSGIAFGLPVNIGYAW